MKRKLLLFFFLLIISISVRGQTNVYHPFPDSNAVWNIDYVVWLGCGTISFPYTRYERYSYILNSDTTINNLQYHKVEIPFVEINCVTAFPHNLAGYKGCLREDTAARKIYFIYPNDSVDSLLFDFTLLIGDSVKGVLVYGPSCFHPYVVSETDSILINNNYRKRWTITSQFGPGQYIIEGIGSAGGLIESICQVIDGPESWLTCFRQDGITIYPNSTINCNLIDGIINVSDENISLTLSPNPATSEIKIENSKSKIEGVEIYDVVGEKHRTPSLSKGEGVSVDVSSLASGIYFVLLRGEKNNIAAKFIKQ